MLRRARICICWLLSGLHAVTRWACRWFDRSRARNSSRIVGVQVQLPVVDAQRPAAEVDVVLAGQHEAELPAQRVRRRVGDAWKGVDTLEPGLAPSALDEELERPRRDAAPLERREDHPTDLMDRAAVPL